MCDKTPLDSNHLHTVDTPLQTPIGSAALYTCKGLSLNSPPPSKKLVWVGIYQNPSPNKFAYDKCPHQTTFGKHQILCDRAGYNCHSFTFDFKIPIDTSAEHSRYTYIHTCTCTCMHCIICKEILYIHTYILVCTCTSTGWKPMYTSPG